MGRQKRAYQSVTIRDWILPGQGRDLRIIRADILRRPDGNAMVHSNTSY